MSDSLRQAVVLPSTPMLVTRRAVDLLRVASMLCR
ncbi:putative leader peptide [Gordonia sp. NPDC003585]